MSLAHYASAVLGNGLGQYRDALAAAEHAGGPRPELGFAMWALAELIEAAVRSGETGSRRRRPRAAGSYHPASRTAWAWASRRAPARC